ncbi:MAG: hypothetical protein LBV69_09225 [Bacteroidales bacterium]|jgi:hypothetical protein|nr:hypothetical protein [Bacteroidales bacterium]
MWILKGNCISIVGYNRGIIYNLFDNSYYFIPKTFAKMFQKSAVFNKKLQSEDSLNFFKDNKLIIEISKNQIRQFPQVTPEYINKNDFEHVVIEICNQNIETIDLIIKKISNFKIKSIEFIFSDNVELDFALTIINKINLELNIAKVITLKYDLFLRISEKINLNTIDYVKTYSCSEENKLNLQTSKYSYLDANYWKMNETKLFFNFDFFAEAISYHVKFNQMIFIDKNGNIKQNPLGNSVCNYMKLNKNFLTNNIFTELWYVSKEKCHVCKNCEFRYMCVDARIPLKINDNEYYFKEECTYNPYICKWQGEEGYVPVEECGTYGKETGFVPDKEKIEKLNQEIWKE